MVAIIVYVANTIKGLRIVDVGKYGIGLPNLSQDQVDGVDKAGYDVDSGDSVLGREDNLKVLSASNTILALVLVGVLVLQVGQWYADRADERLKREFLEKERLEREGGEGVRRTGSKDKKRQ